MFARLRKFWKDIDGATTVEMALVTPILAACVVAGYQVWDAANRKNDMRLALQPATRYYMNVGATASDTTAQALALAAWHSPPSNAAVTTVRSCRCAQTAISCASLCSGNKAPNIFVTLTATGSWTGVQVGSSYTETAVTRVK